MRFSEFILGSANRLYQPRCVHHLVWGFDTQSSLHGNPADQRLKEAARRLYAERAATCDAACSHQGMAQFFDAHSRLRLTARSYAPMPSVIDAARSHNPETTSRVILRVITPDRNRAPPTLCRFLADPAKTPRHFTWHPNFAACGIAEQRKSRKSVLCATIGSLASSFRTVCLNFARRTEPLTANLPTDSTSGSLTRHAPCQKTTQSLGTKCHWLSRSRRSLKKGNGKTGGRVFPRRCPESMESCRASSRVIELRLCKN
jgi:hypothetical protein